MTDDTTATRVGYSRSPRIAVLLWIARFREGLKHDLPFGHAIASRVAYLVGAACAAVGWGRAAMRWFSVSFAAADVPGVRRALERRLVSSRPRPTISSDQGAPILARAITEHIATLAPRANTQKFFADPARMFGSMAIVLKAATDTERGVITICYSHTFPLFARLFDINRVIQRYYLVLEPSWTGLCNLEDLAYLHLDRPVFVQAYEPRDRSFISSLRSNLVPIPVAINWWVDHRTFMPLADVARDVDVIMVAGWADFKRHYRLFTALRALRRRGVTLRAVLVGYPMQRSLHHILELAAYYGVSDQLEVYEQISQSEVNRHLNRSKVNLVWSRREGVNRAVIEGLFAGTPCLLRSGFNYGYPYPYVNDLTGCFATESALAETLQWFAENGQRFSPRTWALDNMSCQQASRILAETIGEVATQRGERWSGDVAVKVNSLGGMHYWSPTDRERFTEDYAFLSSCRRIRADEN